MPGADAYKRYFWINIAKAFTEETYPKLEAVKTTYSGKQVITLKSAETISLFELTQPGISSNQTVVRIDQSGDRLSVILFIPITTPGSKAALWMANRFQPSTVGGLILRKLQHSPLARSMAGAAISFP
jgi:hypothetical protein